jgi:hypothetical protein
MTNANILVIIFNKKPHSHAVKSQIVMSILLLGRFALATFTSLFHNYIYLDNLNLLPTVSIS